MPEEAYDEISRALSSDQSPVGIDARHTHILILHALERLERRFDGGAGVAASTGSETRGTADLHGRIESVLDQVPAAKSLSAPARARLTRAMARAIGAAAGSAAADEQFPSFVSDLIDGVFDAIVDASIRQMEAYAELLDEVAEELEEFGDASDATPQQRQRQRLLATMVLMGTTRARVKRKGLRLRSIFDGEEEDEDEN